MKNRPVPRRRARAAPIDAPALSPAEVLANLSDEELQKWAGKALVRKALKILAADLPVEIEAAASLVVRFPTRNITCRWIPSGGLLSMICSCQAENVCEHVVTAVLAYQASLGKRKIALQEAALTESGGARAAGRTCWPPWERSCARWSRSGWRDSPRPRRSG